MEIIAGKYAVSYTSDGSYYAYLLAHEQCCTYGESEEDAIESLEAMEEEYLAEVNALYRMEEMS